MKTKSILSALLAFIFLISIASALSVTSSSTDTIKPGSEGDIFLDVENTFNFDLNEGISVSINTAGLPFIPVGASEKSTEELDEGDEETFRFTIKASNTAESGDYQIPYTIKYFTNNTEKTKTGFVGVTIFAQPELSYSIETENPVLAQQGKINFKVVNSGFSDARFVSVKVFPDGFTLLSESNIYIGSVDSDDFETASYDVVFDKQDSDFIAQVEYTDFNNKKITKQITLPVQVYTKEEALELGLIKRSNVPLYIGIVILIIVILLIYRAIAKRRRLKRSMQKVQEMK
ncbi:hypothetical protein HYZ97_03190 [Candidatus Pacearchaeota archaeon]|nr:hypothetical protein [Candidatus Pacearchaeota archaeon]